MCVYPVHEINPEMLIVESSMRVLLLSQPNNSPSLSVVLSSLGLFYALGIVDNVAR